MRSLDGLSGQGRRRASADELLHRGIAVSRPAPRAIELPSLRGTRKSKLHSRSRRGKWWMLAVLFILSGTAYGIWIGGQGERLYGQLQGGIDALAVAAGFGVKTITIEGQRHIGDAEIAAALGAGPSTMMLSFDTDAAKARLEQIAWVRHAQVMRLLPSTLQIVLDERVPYAVWQVKGKTYVVDEEGLVLAPIVREAYPDLPLVVGDGAAKNAAALFGALKPYPELREQLLAASRVGDRRWTLQLLSGLEIMLPDDNVDDALHTFVEVDHDRGLLGKNVAAVDLRLGDRVTLRLHQDGKSSPDAASEAADIPTASTKSIPSKGNT